MVINETQPALEKLCQIINDRQRASADTSYTARLLTSGTAQIGAKVTEEAEEVVFAALEEGPDAHIRESADLLYHLCVLSVDQGIKPAAIWSEMYDREALYVLVDESSRPKNANDQ